MNEDTLMGEGREVVGKVKKVAGDATNDPSLEAEGVIDQLVGKAQKTVGAARETLAAEGAPLLARARQFARERPFASAALAGVVGLAILNTLRGKR